jgi:hypothetical protein
MVGPIYYSRLSLQRHGARQLLGNEVGLEKKNAEQVRPMQLSRSLCEINHKLRLDGDGEEDKSYNAL